MVKKNKPIFQTLIVAGGSGKRMRSDLPKQFLLLEGIPLLMHTITRFYNYDKHSRIVVVLPKEHFSTWEMLVKKHKFTIPHIVAEGGTTRFHSVKNGLNHLIPYGIVAIHDAARPFVSNTTISNCIDSAIKKGSGIPCIAPSESVRFIKSGYSFIYPREMVCLIQTPQCFKTELITEAYRTKYLKKFTDDASVYEKSGGRVHLVQGNVENIKITNPSDLFVAEALLKVF